MIDYPLLFRLWISCLCNMDFEFELNTVNFRLHRYWWQMFKTKWGCWWQLWDVGDWSRMLLIDLIRQKSSILKIVTTVLILSPTSLICHHYKVTNIAVAWNSTKTSENFSTKTYGFWVVSVFLEKIFINLHWTSSLGL